MKRRRGTNEQAASAAGVPPARARRGIVHWLDPAGGPGEFLTTEEMLLRFELADLGRLRWLLSMAQGAPIDEAKIVDQIAAITEPHQDESAKDRPASAREALRFVSKFVSEMKQFVEKRGTRAVVKWRIPFGELSKTLTWEDVVIGTSLFLASDWRGAFRLAATRLIELYGKRIQQCAYADCGRLFVGDAVGRQKYCSSQCGAIERQHRFRKKKEEGGETWTEYRRRGRKDRELRREKRIGGSIRKRSVRDESI